MFEEATSVGLHGYTEAETKEETIKGLHRQQKVEQRTLMGEVKLNERILRDDEPNLNATAERKRTRELNAIKNKEQGAIFVMGKL